MSWDLNKLTIRSQCCAHKEKIILILICSKIQTPLSTLMQIVLRDSQKSWDTEKLHPRQRIRLIQIRQFLSTKMENQWCKPAAHPFWTMMSITLEVRLSFSEEDRWSSKSWKATRSLKECLHNKSSNQSKSHNICRQGALEEVSSGVSPAMERSGRYYINMLF